MPADVADEIYAYAAGAFVEEVAVEAEGAQVALEFSEEERCGLAAAGVACALGAE